MTDWIELLDASCSERDVLSIAWQAISQLQYETDALKAAFKADEMVRAAVRDNASAAVDENTALRARAERAEAVWRRLAPVVQTARDTWRAYPCSFAMRPALDALQPGDLEPPQEAPTAPYILDGQQASYTAKEGSGG